MTIEFRQKLLNIGCIVLYLVAFALTGSHPLLAVVVGGFSAALLFLTLTPEARKDKHQRTQTAMLAAAFYLPLLGIAYFKYQEQGDSSHFKAYLAVHDCEAVGVVVGYSKGGCDSRTGACEEGHEVEEPEYQCASTGKRLTFKDFKEGRYGL